MHDNNADMMHFVGNICVENAYLSGTYAHFQWIFRTERRERMRGKACVFTAFSTCRLSGTYALIPLVGRKTEKTRRIGLKKPVYR